jgi:hypothetical protein
MIKLLIPEDVALDIAEIFDEFTPKNKIDRAVNIIRRRYEGNYNFWPTLAKTVRDQIKAEKEADELYALQVAKHNAETEARTQELADLIAKNLEDSPILLGTSNPEVHQTETISATEPEIRDDFGKELLAIKKIVDDLDKEPLEQLKTDVEYTLKRPRQRKGNNSDSDNK